MGERAGPSASENDRALRSRLCRAAASQYRVSPEVKLVSDLCQSQGHSPRPSLSLFLSLSLLSLLLFYVAYASFCSLHLASCRHRCRRFAVPFARDPSEIDVSRSPGLFPGVHIHGSTQCHSVELLPVGKERKLVHKRTCNARRSTAVNNRRHRPPGSLALASKCHRVLHSIFRLSGHRLSRSRCLGLDRVMKR